VAFDPDEIEDGSGKPTAIVYADSAEAEAWLTRRGRTRFTALSAADQDIHLLRGTEYVENWAREKMDGRRAFREQGLLWPRYGVWYEERRIPGAEVPERWKNATFEAAELSAAGEPLGHVVEDKRGVTKETTGRSLVSEFSHAYTKQRLYPAVEVLLHGLVRFGVELERGA